MKAWHVLSAGAVATVAVFALGILWHPGPSSQVARAVPPIDLSTLCTPTRMDAVRTIIEHVNGRDIFVQPSLWNGLKYDARENFAALAAQCIVGGGSISIRHALTGRELATYSPSWGYSGKE